MSKIDEAYEADRNRRLGIDRLTIERNVRPTYDSEPSKPAMPSRHDAQFKQAIKDKYNVQSLQMEGLLGQRIERTLEDALIDDAKSRSVGMKLCHASLTYQDKPIRVWFEVGK